MATKCAINGRQWGAYDGRRHPTHATSDTQHVGGVVAQSDFPPSEYAANSHSRGEHVTSTVPLPIMRIEAEIPLLLRLIVVLG